MVRRAMMGSRVRRKEDPRLITGSSMYVDDLQLANATYAAFFRSPFAHARIKSMDLSAVKNAPGVVAVYTAQDCEDILGPVVEGESEEFTREGIEDASSIPTPRVHALAENKVRWVGEPIALILAETAEQANDAVELVDVDWEELPAVVDLEDAISDDAARVWNQVKNNIALTDTHEEGDVEEAFRNADVTISQRIRSQRLIPMAMEGRATTVAPDPLTGGVTAWTSTQNPHTWRNDVAAQVGLTQSQLRVVAPEVGGGFGSKIGPYQEDFILVAASMQLRRPVRWVEDRSENMLTTHHGRAQIADIELAASNDGKITGMRMHVRQDIGGYPRDLGNVTLTAAMAVGCYDIPALRTEIDGVYTTTMAVGAYRGAGRPEAAYYIERAINILAQEMGKDPAEVRKANFIAPDKFPFTTAAGVKYDSGEYAGALDKALEVSNYQQLRQEQQKARDEGRLMGIGMASYVEICGFGPYDSSVVKVEPSGAVSVYTGISPHGQGQETTFAQMVADQIGANYDDVVVHHGDTDNTAQGKGTMGSRGLVVGGSALMMSLDKVRDKAEKIAAHLLEVAEADIEFEDGQYRVAGTPDRSVTLPDIANAAYTNNLPEGMEPGLNATDYFRPPGETFPFGTHIAVVEIEQDTGKVTLRNYFSIDDCGPIISPTLVEGQVHGGLAQGIGQALWEEAVYDEDSGQLVTATMMDYAVPKAQFFPEFHLDRTITTTPMNPLGVKGIGEAATIGSTPAVANAVMDALQPLGIAHIDLPLTPPRVWKAIQDAQSS